MKMIRLIFFLLLIFLLNIDEVAYSQASFGCKRLVEWNDVILKEFPEIDFYRTASRNKEAYELMVYNMYSDKVFAPIFGKSYSEMSSFRRNRIYYQLRGCKAKSAKYVKSTEQARTILNLMSKHSTGKYSADNVAIKVEKINNLRKEYESILNRLSGNAEVTMEEIETYNSKLSGNFKRLLPSERDKLEQLIKNKEENAAFVKLKSIAQTQIAKPNSYQSLLQLNSFRDDNRSLFDLLDNFQKGEINDMIRNKSNEILAELLPPENNKIKAIKNSNSPITEFNEAFKNFDRRYNEFTGYPEVRESFNLIKSEKTKFITSRNDDLIKKIKGAQSITEIESIKSTYLSYTSASDSVITQLNNLCVQKVSHIKETERQKQIAEKQRMEQEERERQIAGSKFLKQHGFISTDKSFWESLDRYYGEDIGNLIMGDFEAITIKENWKTFFTSAMFTGYISQIDENCPELLPASAIVLPFRDEWQSSELEGFTPLTKNLIIANYEQKNNVNEWEITLDPAHKEMYLKCANNIRSLYTSLVLQCVGCLNNATQGVSNFYDKIGCNKKALKLVEENLTRYLEGRKSIQQEVGIIPDS